MEKHFGIALTVAALLIGFVISGFVFHFGAVSSQPFGSTVGYLSSNGNVLTFNAFNSLLTDVQSLRTPLAGVKATSSANFTPVALGPLGSATSSNSSTITWASAFTLGDKVVIGESVATDGVIYTPIVLNSSTLEVWYSNFTGAAITPSTSTIQIVDLGSAFNTPAALVTATSASAN